MCSSDLAGGDEDVGFADGDVDGAIGKTGVGAGGERDPETGHGDIMFLIHFLSDDTDGVRACG